MITKAFPMVLALAAAAYFPAVAEAQARTFTVQGGGRASFVSDAPLETINGVASGVTGSFSVDPANLTTASGTVEVRVASLRTGIDLRDEHLRSDSWLDATRFPTAKFEITSVRGATSLTPGRTARLTLAGHFTLHGRTRDITANADVQLLPPEAGATTSNTIRVSARFRVHLPDYGVSVPSLVRLKVSDDIAVTVSFRARAA
jgi:polyisoprenoid-binding protein YceI